MRQISTLKALCSGLLTFVLSLCIGSLIGFAEPKAFDYILPEADTHYYTEGEIADMPLQVVCYAKNEIYARHGRQFRSAELTEYFNEQVWYSGSISPDLFSDAVFNDYEMKNILLLDAREKALQSGGYVLNQPGYSFAVIYRYIADRYNAQSGLSVSADHTVVPGTDATSAYLQILQESQPDIAAYNWQAYPDMDIYPNPDPKPVAFFDLTGDGQEELLFLTARRDKDGQLMYQGILHIYTWNDGHAQEIYHDLIDHAIAGGCYYVIYQNLGTGGLSIFTSGGDENWTNTLTEYQISQNGVCDTSFILEDYSYPDYNSANYETIHDYYINQEVTSAGYYHNVLQNSWANRGTVLIWSDYGSVANELGTLPDMIAMTYADAIRSLTTSGQAGSLDQISGIPVTDEDEAVTQAYRDFLSSNQDLFTQQDHTFWYGTYDIDRDGTEELFVRYAAGVRYALQIFTCTDGQVANICPSGYDGEQVLYAAEEIMENGADSSICIGSTGGAAYHYNTTYIKQGNKLVKQYTLLRDYAEDTYTRDDVLIREDEYYSLLSGYYEARIEFVSYID